MLVLMLIADALLLVAGWLWRTGRAWSGCCAPQKFSLVDAEVWEQNAEAGAIKRV